MNEGEGFSGVLSNGKKKSDEGQGVHEVVRQRWGAERVKLRILCYHVTLQIFFVWGRGRENEREMLWMVRWIERESSGEECAWRRVE